MIAYAGNVDESGEFARKNQVMCLEIQNTELKDAKMLSTAEGICRVK